MAFGLGPELLTLLDGGGCSSLPRRGRFFEDITAVAVLANVAELESSSLRDLYLRSEVKCRVERALIHARFLAPHDSARRGPAADWCMLRATDVVELWIQLCTRPTALVSCTRHMSQKKENE